MKLVSLAAAVCLFSSLLAAQTTTAFHSNADGAFALVRANNMTAEIDVNRGDSSTFLDIFATSPGSNGGFTVTTGFGTIPNADFVTDGFQRMALNVDTSQIAGFQSVTCTVSFTPFFSETCQPGPLGLIQVNWTANGIETFNIIEERHTTQGGLTVDLHINSSNHSANASGSYLGSSFPTAGAAATALNNDTTVTITQ